MKLKKLHIKDFISFKDTQLEFNIDDKPTLYLIQGQNLDSLDDSANNGCGKSSLIGETLSYNLFGRSLRGTNKKIKANEIVRIGSKSLSNIVEYQLDEDNILKIERTKNSKGTSGNINVELNNVDVSKRTKVLTTDDIQDYINMNIDTWQQIVCYYVDNPNILSMNYSQRLDFFKNIINLDILDVYYDEVKRFKEDNNRFLIELNAKQKANQDIIKIVSENNDEYTKFLNEKIKELKEQYFSIKKEIDNFIIDDTYDKENNNLETEKRGLEVDKEEIQKKVNSYDSNIKQKEREIIKIKNEINSIEKLKGIQCPTCFQDVSEKYVHRCVKLYNENLENINKIINQEKDLKVTEQTKISEINSKINDINEKIRDNNKKKNEILRKKSSLEGQLDSIVKDGKKYKSELENINKKNNTEEKKSLYEFKDKCYTKAIKTRNEWKEKSEFWSEMFQPKSKLRSTIIQKYLIVLSDIFEYHVSKLYNNEINGKIFIDDEGNIDIILFKENNEINYWNLSSGERKRIDLSMFFALNEFYSYLNPNMPKFIVLDEIFDSLDKPGIELVTDTIKEMMDRLKLDIFVISHIPINLENKYINCKKIMVTKKDGISDACFLD